MIDENKNLKETNMEFKRLSNQKNISESVMSKREIVKDANNEVSSKPGIQQLKQENENLRRELERLKKEMDVLKETAMQETARQILAQESLGRVLEEYKQMVAKSKLS